MTHNFEQKTKTNLSCRTRSGIQAFKASGFRLGGRNDKRSSFTLIELLVVLALVAILSVVVVMTLNPAELLKQARDSNRLSDLSTINTALNLFSTDVTSGFMGTSTIVYISIPDSSPTCANLGLPTSTTFTYNCVTSANLRKTDGTGWIPVNFQRISSNSPISQLPIDPVNTTSSGNYYTYVTGGSWMLTAIPESQKQKTELSNNPHLSKFPGVIGLGNNLDISPLYNPSGLIGYWKFDEGNGTTVKDSSGYGGDGTWNGTLGAQWATGKVGGSGMYNGSNNYVTTNLTAINTTTTYAIWIKSSNPSAAYQGLIGNSDANPGYNMLYDNYAVQRVSWWNNGGVPGLTSSLAITDTNWHHIVATRSGSSGSWLMKIYIDGRFNASSTDTQNPTAVGTIIIGKMRGDYGFFPGQLDDVRVYNRELTAAEVAALYNSSR